MTNGPIEPSADMRAFAKMCHEMFVALGMEGFSTQEALTIIGQMIAANTGGGQ
jgi:hypothetical protein